MMKLRNIVHRAKSLVLGRAGGSIDVVEFKDARRNGAHEVLLDTLSALPQEQHAVIARMAELRQDLHHFPEARRLWQKAAKLPENPLQDRIHVAACAYEQGQIEDSHRILSDLAERHPREAPPQLRLAQFYLQQRRWVELDALLLRLGKDTDLKKAVESLRFQEYLRQENYAAARELWTEVGHSHQDAGYPEAVTLALDSRDVAAARSQLQEWQKLNRYDEDRFLEAELRYLNLTRQFGSAVERFVALYGSETDHPLRTARLARLLINAGQVDEALKHVDQIPPIWHRHRQVAPLVSYALIKRDDDQAAKQTWNAVPFWSGVHTEPSISKPIQLVKPGSQDPSSRVRLFATLRNERNNLPWFFDYYRSIGIREFYMIDNGSEDGSHEYIADQEDAHLFHSDENFRDNLYATYWLNHLIETYAGDGWAINVDIDEMLVLPDIEENSINGCIGLLEANGDEAVLAPLLDMYPEKIAQGESYRPGDNPLDHSPYFDNRISEHPQVNCPYLEVQGGSSERFTGDVTVDILTKAPLFRAGRGIKMFYICHQLTPAKVSQMRGALLHFKFIGPFVKKIRAEAERGIHFSGGKRYKLLAEFFDRSAGTSLLGPDSVRYENSDQLIKLGVISNFQRDEGAVT